MQFSDYIVYVDESGDHGLVRIDPNYPVFVLAFCIFEKEAYRQRCVPALQAFKFKHFGHDMAVLHEREIRKAQGDFKFLVDRSRRAEFMEDLSLLVEGAEFTLIASAINKTELQAQYAYPANPYDLALAFCLERLHFFLNEHGNDGKVTHVIFESRGRREDDELELELRRVCDGQNMAGESLPFAPVFAAKQVNCCGLQLADLVARPIGRHILRPDQENRAYEVIESKYRRSGGKVRGRGLKVFP